MPNCVHINFEGKLHGKGRPRFGKGRTYTPAKTKAAENDLGWAAKIAMAGMLPFEGPIKLVVSVIAQRPKSWSKAKAMNYMFVTSKPDADNQLKLICDALNRIVWKDDVQVAVIDFQRTYGLADRVYIRVDELPTAGDRNAYVR